MTERTLLRTIVREVGDALRNERVAKTAPRELSTEVYTQRAKSRWCRYAWNASRSRVYVLRRTEGVQLVVTVLSTVHSQA